MYKVKEIFYSLQGEGANTGRPAVFVRFAGCNLWSGREADREKASCRFCDTDFVGGDVYRSSRELTCAILEQWKSDLKPFIIFTGGEPLLQLDATLRLALYADLAVETNGTIEPPAWINWLTVSPKSGTTLRATKGNELKLVYPQDGISPEQFTRLKFKHFFLQPMDGPNLKENTEQAVRYCLDHPQWKLSLQTHKMLGLR